MNLWRRMNQDYSWVGPLSASIAATQPLDILDIDETRSERRHHGYGVLEATLQESFC